MHGRLYFGLQENDVSTE